MHEFSMAEELLDIVKTHAEAKNAKRVVSVNIRLSEFSSVTPDALSFSFVAISKGTIADGAALVIERMPLIVRCKGCGMEGTVNIAEDVVSKMENMEGNEHGHEHLKPHIVNPFTASFDKCEVKGGVEGIFNCNNCGSKDFDVISCGELSLERMELDV